MSGATDAPFRRQAVRFGARAVVSEMVAGEALATGRPDMVRRTCRHDGEGAWIVQLAARRPEDMKAGAHLLAEAGVDIIDINMGCPARKVTGGQSGSALMRTPDLAESIMEAALEGAGRVPVTLKMRLGWDHEMLNAPHLARVAERLGLKWLAVHGRTRCMFYKGEADWAAIADTVDAVDLPVIANGDIDSLPAARTCLADSGAHAVMIGRAAMGRPWLVAEIEAGLARVTFKAPTLDEQLDSLCEQIEDSVSLYGGRLGVRIVRKHVAAAIDMVDLPLSEDSRRELRGRLCRIDDAGELRAALANVYQHKRERVAA